MSEDRHKRFFEGSVRAVNRQRQEKFFGGFEPFPVELLPKLPTPSLRPYKVRLFRSKRVLRGWLSMRAGDNLSCTVVVEVMAMTGQRAKNVAITAANKGFDGAKILRINRGTKTLFDANNYPELSNLTISE